MSSSPSSTPMDPRALLQHAGFLRSLALRLVRDDAEADDVVQESWLRALKRPPLDRGSSRAWLARVVTSVVQQRRRAGQRRDHHERAAATPAATGPTADREEQLAQLVRAVLGLEQPYRRTILERYFEDLKPSAIAKRHKVPVTTVYSWVKRAHQLLRARLDQESGGDRQHWIAGLAVTLGLPRTTAAATATGLGVSGKLAVGGLAAAAVVTAAIWWRSEPRDNGQLGADERVVASANGAATENSPGNSQNAAAPTSDRTSEPSAELPVSKGPSPGSPPASTDASAQFGRLVGTVLDPDGWPRAGVTLEWAGGRGVTGNDEIFPRAVSGGDGRFERKLAAGRYRLVAQDAEESWNVLRVVDVRPGEDTECEIRLRHALRGRVVDGAGRGLEGVYVEARFFIPGWVLRPEAETDRDGFFQLVPLPAIPVELVVLADGAERSAPPVWSASVEDTKEPVEIVLDEDATRPGTIRGRFQGDIPALHEANIGLWFSEHAVEYHDVAADGSFRIDSVAPGLYRLELCELGPAWNFAEVELGSGEDLDLGRIAIPEPVRLRLSFADSGLPPLDTLIASVQPTIPWGKRWDAIGAPDEISDLELAPGPYSITLWRRSYTGDEDGFGAAKRVELDRPVDEVRLPDSDSIDWTLEVIGAERFAGSLLQLEVRDEHGSLFQMMFPCAQDRPSRARLLLDAGTYELVLTSDRGDALGRLKIEVDANTRGTVVPFPTERR